MNETLFSVFTQTLCCYFSMYIPYKLATKTTPPSVPQTFFYGSRYKKVLSTNATDNWTMQINTPDQTKADAPQQKRCQQEAGSPGSYVL